MSVRPGYIVGPGDPTDRWTYWPVRTSMGGDMLVPGTPEDPVQFIDARDLGGWMVRMLENEVGGVYNALGPVEPMTMGSMLETCRAVTGSDAVFHWADAGFIQEQNVYFPIWSPTTGDFGGSNRGGYLARHRHGIHEPAGGRYRTRHAGVVERPRRRGSAGRGASGRTTQAGGRWWSGRNDREYVGA